MLTVNQISKVLRNLVNKNFKVESLDEMYVSQIMETLFHNLNSLVKWTYGYKNIKEIIAIGKNGKHTDVGFVCHEWDDQEDRFIDLAIFDYSKADVVAQLSQVNMLSNIASVKDGKLYFHLNLIDVFDQE